MRSPFDHKFLAYDLVLKSEVQIAGGSGIIEGQYVVGGQSVIRDEVLRWPAG